MSKHTPTDWGLDGKYNVINADNRGICTTGGYSDESKHYHEENKANAQFIVKACNLHGQLKATCSELLEHLSFSIDSAECDDERDTMQQIYDSACELLTKEEATDGEQ